MTKNYKQILPVFEDVLVKDQFGCLPLSIMEFCNTNKWNDVYLEPLKEEKRRNNNTKYLSGYGFSEFNSGLTEFILRYWSMKNSIIVDPFSGRATRAIISSKLNRKYYGYEISPKTYNRCIEYFKKLNINPTLYLGDGCLMKDIQSDFAHLVMTCPPYFNIEKYENVNNQLSNCNSYELFLEKIKECSVNINRILKPGGFCCWVCADWRDVNGFKQFSNDSINIFKSSLLIPHDTVILKNNSPFAAFQAYKSACQRKTSKIHETLLVFKKSGQLDLTGLESDKEENEFFTV